MRAKSVASSRFNSGGNTPREYDEPLDSELRSPVISAKLQDRLRELDLANQNNGEDEEERHPGYSKNGLVHSLEILGVNRKKTSEQAREHALGTLLTQLVMKYDPSVLHHELFSILVDSFLSARTEFEAIASLQLICVSMTMIEESGDIASADSLEMATDLQRSLLGRLRSAESPQVKESIIVAFAVLTYFMNAGGGGYGMEKAVNSLMEIAESVSGPENERIVGAAVGGAALLTTLVSEGTANEIANDWLLTLTPMINTSQLTARQAIFKFIAVLAERAGPEVLKSSDEVDELIETLESISQESVNRTAKREKKAQNLLVKSVLRLLNFVREDDDATLEEDRRHIQSDIVSQYHRNTVSKSLGVISWSALVVVEHLTWVFGPGLHNHLANNVYVKSLLVEEDVQIDSATLPDEAEVQETDRKPSYREQLDTKVDEAKRSKDLRKQQLQKIEQQGRLEDQLSS